MSSVYQYHTLDPGDIRLLRLFSGDEDDDLAGTLEAFTLHTQSDVVFNRPPMTSTYGPPPPYIALSYYWGQQDATAKLWLSHSKSASTNPFLKIKPNLASALKKLRRDIEPGEQMDVWSDAICINQADIPERNGQIQKMADIYSAAKEVHIWLGDEEEDSGLAMQFAKEIKNPKYFQQAIEQDRPDEWLAFSKLILRDWFSRRWIVQEISLAKAAVVHCGQESIPWDDLEEAVSILSAGHRDVRKQLRSSKQHGNPLDFLGEIKGMGALHLVEIASNVTQRTPTDDRCIMEHRMSLEGLMSSLTMFDTSDPYDVVYALLWLAHDVRPDAALSDINVMKTPLLTPNTGNSPNTTTTMSQRHLAINADSSSFERRLSSSEHLKIEEQKQDQSDERLVVDYNMSLFDCYKKFLEHVFRRSKSLDIICRAWALEPRDQAPDGAPPHWKAEQPLPTWIKTLSDGKVFEINPAERIFERIQADPLVGRPGTGPRHYNACGKRKHDGEYAVIRDGDRSLVARGFALGEIQARDDAASKGNIPEGWLNMLGWTCKPHKKLKPRSEPLGTHDRPDWLWRFLVAERGHDGYEPPPKRFRSTCTWLLDHRTPGGGLETDPKVRNSWPVLSGEFVDRVRAVVWDRRLITIQYGSNGKVLFGMGPKNASVGDLVCILFGCSVPVVLRKSKKGSLSESTATKPNIQTPIIFVEKIKSTVNGSSKNEPGAKRPRLDTSKNEQNGKRPRLDTSMSLALSNTLAVPESPVRVTTTESAENESTDLFDTSGELYEFIGECYVYGMMAGEAFKHRADNGIANRYWTLV